MSTDTAWFTFLMAVVGFLAGAMTALVEKHHSLPMSFWAAVAYRVDERIVRRDRSL